MLKKNHAIWQETLKVALPLCLSYIPVGLACGVLLQKVGFNGFYTALISFFVFSGGAQFLAAAMLVDATPIASIILMTLFLELRYILLSSSLSTFIKKEKKGFISIFTRTINDENYAVNYLKFSTDKNWTSRKALMVNRYSLASWLLSNVAGTMLGSVIPLETHIVDFALTAMFIYMFTMQLQNKLIIFVGLFSGVLSVVTMLLFQSTIGLILATVIASLTGYFIEKKIKLTKLPEKPMLRDSKPFETEVPTTHE
ncbi:AzlC family ABC transporter permease [Carnobacterium gallinarum]|uniref:AzlC family ABC transporter permease n=1 Tax=Carnobacterium gallinarum TaxID=2749 RepID=UPI000553DE0D|nr:AzlC family ABC transporter permease [Carnobacterium gallinarum]